MAIKKTTTAKKVVTKKTLPKAQDGRIVKPTADSTDYYKKDIQAYNNLIKSEPKTKMGKSNVNVYLDAKIKAYNNLNRQSLKGKPGYDKNGFPIKGTTTKKKG